MILVDRQRGGLTDDGVAVVERARRVLHELDDITADMASRGDEVRGDSRFGVIGTTARWLLPQLLTRVEQQHPGVHVTVHEGNTTALVPRVPVRSPRRGDGAPAGRRRRRHRAAAVRRGPGAAGHTAAPPRPARHHPPGRRWPTTPLLLPPTGTALRRIIDRAAGAVDCELTAQVEIDGVRLLASLAFEGYGAAIVPATAIPRWLKADFKRIAVPELPRRVVGWVQRKRPAPERADPRRCSRCCATIVDEQGAKQPGVHVGADAFPFGTGRTG